MAPKDPKQTAATSSGGSGGGGFFASIASSLSNFGSVMSKSVDGYEIFGVWNWKVVKFICFDVVFFVIRLCGVWLEIIDLPLSVFHLTLLDASDTCFGWSSF